VPPVAAEKPGNDTDGGIGQTTPPAALAPAAAARFAALWARPGLPAGTWWAQVAPLCEPGFAARLRTVDPQNIPARKVTGPPKPVPSGQDGALEFSVPADGGMILVTVSGIGGKWLVTTNGFARRA
jgi:hypothetical protein